MKKTVILLYEMQIDLKHTLVLLRPDGIIQVNCSDCTYNKQDIIDVTQAQVELSKGEKKLLLVIGSEDTNVESEAREFMAKEENTMYSIAEAYVIKSLGQRILVNFYIKVSKPKVPTMFFSNVNDAEKWLKSFV